MDGEYAPWIALGCGVIGMLIGYFMGYRTGRIAGELAALKAKRIRRDRYQSSGPRDSSNGERGRDLEDSEDLELASRLSDA